MRTIARLVIALVLALTATFGVAQTATAVPADLWISKQAMKMAWAEQSYSDRVTLCSYFAVSPSSMVRRLVNSQTGLTSWERRSLRIWMRGFLTRKCMYL